MFSLYSTGRKGWISASDTHPQSTQIHTQSFKVLVRFIHSLPAGYPQPEGWLSTGYSQTVILAVVSEDVIAGVDEVIQGLEQVFLALGGETQR